MAEVAVVVWAVTADDSTRHVIAFGHRTVATGGSLRSYSIDLEAAAAREQESLPRDCDAAADGGPDVSLLVWGDEANDLINTHGQCLRWVEADGAYFSMVWPEDRDCDGAKLGMPENTVCAEDPMQCARAITTENASPFDSSEVEDDDGDDYSATLDLLMCQPCFRNGDEVACDCEVPEGDNVDVAPGAVNFGTDVEKCNGADDNCDGEYSTELYSSDPSAPTLCTGLNDSGARRAGVMGCTEQPGEMGTGCQLDDAFASSRGDGNFCESPHACELSDLLVASRGCQILVSARAQTPCPALIPVIPFVVDDLSMCTARLWSEVDATGAELKHFDDGVTEPLAVDESVLCNSIVLMTTDLLSLEQTLLIEVNHPIGGHYVTDLILKPGNEGACDDPEANRICTGALVFPD